MNLYIREYNSIQSKTKCNIFFNQLQFFNEILSFSVNK